MHIKLFIKPKVQHDCEYVYVLAQPLGNVCLHPEYHFTVLELFGKNAVIPGVLLLLVCSEDMQEAIVLKHIWELNTCKSYTTLNELV